MQESTDYNPITVGMIKALGNLSGMTAKDKAQRKRFQYHDLPPLKHRAPIKGRPDNTVLVAHRYRQTLDYSRYTAQDLRAIRARGGGQKEQDRARQRTKHPGITIIDDAGPVDWSKLVAAAE